MTVESQVSKTQKMVMGATNTYDFFFHCLTKDPTEEAAKQAIKVSISDGVNKTELTYGTDYAVKLNDDGTGGTVTVADKKTSAYSLIVYREYDYRQSSDYQNYNAFPADTLEHNLDKATMLCQQLQEQANRAVTVDVFSDTDPAELIDKVETLYADKDNLDLLANNMFSIKTDAENIGVIKTAANNIGAVQTASGSIEAVKTVSDAVNDVVLCAAEIAAIKDAPNQASAASASASAALASQNASAVSQTEAKQSELKAAAWKYRAFPRSVNGVYCLDKRNCFGVWVYGYYIDEAAPVTSTRVHKIEGCDNYFYERAYMDFENNRFEWGDWRNAPFLPRPCMLKRSGEVAYYLDPDNYLKKADGTASDVANSAFDGNAMMEWNTVFMKKYRDRNRIYVFFSNVKQDSGFECFSTLKADGTYAEHFYTPIYEGNLVDNVMRSMSLNTVAQSSSTADQEAAYAEANGAGWTTTVWADEDLITALFVLMFENTDSQAALGNGNINGGTSAAAFLPTGAGNQKGMFWGSNTNNQCVKVFGMENWWGNRWRRPNGVLLIEGIYHVKMTRSTADGSTTTGYNRTGTGYINTGLTTEGDYNAAYISRVHGGKYGFLVAKAAGSSTTFYADGHWSARTGTRMLLRGGACFSGALCGALAFTVSELPSDAGWDFGASLSYRNS